MAKTKGTRAKSEHGPGQGWGWGGPAKGGGDRPGQPFEAGTRGAVGCKPRSEMSSVERMRLENDRAERAEDFFCRIMDSEDERTETRMQAATKVHEIYKGKPVARVITAAVDDVRDLHDDALRHELAVLRGKGTDAPAGVAATPVSDESNDLVH